MSTPAITATRAIVPTMAMGAVFLAPERLISDLLLLRTTLRSDDARRAGLLTCAALALTRCASPLLRARSVRLPRPPGVSLPWRAARRRSLLELGGPGAW